MGCAMKGEKFWLLVPIALVLLAACATQQHERGFRWKAYDDGVIITVFRGRNRDVYIPPYIQGMPVTGIGDRAFFNRALTSVAIPDSVISIGAFAFGANQLTNVSIPDSVIYIGDGAFSGNWLTSVTIGNGVTYIGSGAFVGNQLTSIAIPDSVTHIGDGAFSGNWLTSVTIPDNVTFIGDWAFHNNQLASVTIGNSVTSIGVEAFHNNQLVSVTIGNNVTSIGRHAFSSNQLTSITIPDSVTSIGQSAFENNQLTSVTIPGSVTSIGLRAFANNRLSAMPNTGEASVAADAFAGNPVTVAAQVPPPQPSPVVPPPQISPVVPPPVSPGPGIEPALARAAGNVSRHFTSESRIAIVYVSAPDGGFADFIAYGLEHLLHMRGFNIVDRSQLDRIRDEQQLGLTGEVDDGTAARIGHFAGASVVITGRVVGDGELRRLNLRALETTTAGVIGTAFEPF